MLTGAVHRGPTKATRGACLAESRLMGPATASTGANTAQRHEVRHRHTPRVDARWWLLSVAGRICTTRTEVRRAACRTLCNSATGQGRTPHAAGCKTLGKLCCAVGSTVQLTFTASKQLCMYCAQGARLHSITRQPYIHMLYSACTARRPATGAALQHACACKQSTGRAAACGTHCRGSMRKHPTPTARVSPHRSSEHPFRSRPSQPKPEPKCPQRNGQNRTNGGSSSSHCPSHRGLAG